VPNDAVTIVLLGAVAAGVPASFLAEAFGLPQSVANTWRLARLARRCRRG
jgi:hypothetical protein